MINEPGVFYDMPSTVYFADPCPEPSLTQSIAKILLERSPLHAWHAHPRLNPNFEPDNDTKFDIGNVAHRLILGRGKEFVVLPFDDWKTKAAREAREMAAANRKLAVLAHQFERATAMVHAARDQLELRGLSHFFRIGNAEVVMAWQEGDIWFRQMLDWLIDGQVMLDYKSTDMSVAPHNLGRMIAAGGWDVQAAMAERGLNALACSDAGRRYIFVVQETEPPYCLSVLEISPDVLAIGRKKLDAAAMTWRVCMHERRWPGYPTEIHTPEYPAWAEHQWLEREVKDAARERLPKEPVNILMGG
jgi:PDDEXK-like domain of unknown function (DUF3799)